MSLKKVISLLLVSALALTTITACQGTKYNAIELVPDEANLIANIQISRIINDQDIRDAYDETEKPPDQPQTFEAALDEMVEEIGIDLNDFSQAVVFVNTDAMEQDGYIGIIIEGTFEAEQFIDNIQRETGEKFSPRDYKDTTIYYDEKEEVALAFLSEKTLIGGTPEAVKDIIDVSNDDRESISGPILDTYNQFGNALVKLAFELPEDIRKSLGEEASIGDIPLSFESLVDIDVSGFAFNKDGETYNILINSHFLSTDSAQDAKDAVSGFISLYKGMAEDPEIKELLGSVEVTVTDSWMKIVFYITISDIEQMMERF